MHGRGADEGDDGQVERQDEELAEEQDDYLLGVYSFNIIHCAIIIII